MQSEISTNGSIVNSNNYKYHKFDGSSNILWAVYDFIKLELVVKFRSGYMYKFSRIPANVYESLVSSNSPGKYFHSSIKGKYAAVKIASTGASFAL